MSRRTIVPDLIVGALILIALGLLFLGFGEAKAQDAPTAPVCHKLPEIASYYGNDEATGDTYEADDAAKLMAALEVFLGPSPLQMPSQAALLLDIPHEQSDIIFYDAMGCADLHAGPMTRDFAVMLAAAAGVATPFTAAPPEGPIPGTIKARYIPASGGPAFADTPTSQWFQSLMIANPEGGVAVSCCDQSDCRATKADFQDGHWVADSVQFPGEKVIVPTANVKADEVSPIGSAVICEAVGGLKEFKVLTMPSGMGDYVYCFVPPFNGL